MHLDMSLAAPLEKPDFRRSCLTVATREVSTRGRLGGVDRCGAGERRRPTEAEREVDASAGAIDPRTSPCLPREELPESSNSFETAVLVTEPSRAEAAKKHGDFSRSSQVTALQSEN